MSTSKNAFKTLKPICFAVLCFVSKTEAPANNFAILLQKDSPRAKLWMARLDAESTRFQNQKPEVPRQEKSPLMDSRSSLARMICWSVKQRLQPDTPLKERIQQELIALSTSKNWPTTTPLAMAEWVASYSVGLTNLDKDDKDSKAQELSSFLKSELLPKLLTIWSTNGAWESEESNQRVVLSTSIVLAERALAQHGMGYGKSFVASTEGSNSRYVLSSGLLTEGYAYWRYASSFRSLLDLTIQAKPQNFNSFASAFIAPSGKCANFGDSAEGERFESTGAAGKSGLAILNTALFNNQINWSKPSRLEEQFINQMVSENGPWEEERRFFALAGLSVRAKGNIAETGFYRSGAGNGEIAIWKANPLKPGAFIDLDGAYLAVRAIKAGLPHSQSDAASFIFETDGIRWISDPGKDDYDFPGYFESQKSGRRWSNRFCAPSGHSTFWMPAETLVTSAIPELLINAEVKKVSFGALFGQPQGSLTRSFSFLKNGLVLQDHFAPKGEKVRWNLITATNAKLVNQMVELSAGDKKLLIKTNLGKFVIREFDDDESFTIGESIMKRNDLKRIILELPAFATDVKVELLRQE